MDKQSNTQGVYSNELLTRKVFLTMDQVGQNIKQNLERSISYSIEGKCTQDGYIKPNSVRVNTYSAGIVNNEKVEFQTVFECMVCHPVEDMVIDCKVKTLTKAGIHGEVIDNEGNMPVTVFIARDHHFTNKQFGAVEENSVITTKIIGIRFELNDPYICAIGTLDTETNKK
jgi:DNA-directed RNA polymerase subunit E'/Rpb7|tara:strand:- start:425 stop:937 length:513 start_codon:yes stop_codon:yes gene_type:complete